MSEHTPGPWKWTDGSAEEGLYGAEGQAVVWGCWYNTGTAGCEATSGANARLIAAAPELLGALQWAMAQGQLTYVVRTKANGDYCDAVDHACAAISKATEER